MEIAATVYTRHRSWRVVWIAALVGVVVGAVSLASGVNPVEQSAVRSPVREVLLLNVVLLIAALPGWAVLLILLTPGISGNPFAQGVGMWVPFLIGQASAYALLGVLIRCGVSILRRHRRPCGDHAGQGFPVRDDDTEDRG